MKTDKNVNLLKTDFIRFLILIIIFIFASNQANSQALNARHAKTNTKEFPKRVITSLLVYDNYDNPVKDLGKPNFNLFINGKKGDIAAVNTLANSDKGINTVICMDISGSMAGRPIQDTKEAVAQFINDMASNDYLAIYSYGNGANLVADFSNDKNYLNEQVSKLFAKDQSTSLFYGADKGLEKLKPKANADEPVILIVLGDGNNDTDNDAYKLDDVIAKAKEMGVPIFTFGYTSVNRTNLQNLEKMGIESGGRYFESPNKEQLDKNFRKMRENIRNIYIIAYAIYGLEGTGQEANGLFKVNKGQLNSEVNAKFKLSVAKSIDVPSDNDNVLIFSLIGAVILFGAVGAVIMLKMNKKKKLAIEKKRLEAEEERAIQEAAHRASAAQRASQPIPTFSKKPTETEKPPPLQPNDGGTVIVRPGSPPSGAVSLILDIKVGELVGKQISVNATGAVIGRSEQEATHVLPISTVSKKHAKITFSNGKFFIEDLNSSNGVYINTIRITGPTLISHGNSFKIGGCEGHFLLK